MLNESHDLATACGLVLNRHVNAMLAHEAGARTGEDIEDVHMMRVALRKLRAALTVFRDAVNDAERKSLNRELAWIGDALGEVRDLDVFLDRMAVTRSELDDRSATLLREVDRIIEKQRQTRRDAMIAALNDERYAAFVARLRPRIERHDLALFSGSAANVPILEASQKLLGGFVKKAVKAVGDLRDDSPAEALHAARKKVRRLRYGLDFLGSLYGKPAKKLRRQAKRIQDLLGEHQDAIVAQDVLWAVVEELRDEGTTAPPETYVAAGQAIQREARHAEIARERFFAERNALIAAAGKFQRAAARVAACDTHARAGRVAATGTT